MPGQRRPNVSRLSRPRLTLGAAPPDGKRFPGHRTPPGTTSVEAVTADPLLLIGEVDRATARLARTAADLGEADLTTASLLPGWTRAHVLTHVARSADAMVNLLASARTGQLVPPYASAQARTADIEAGATRTLTAHLDDLRHSAERFAEAVATLPTDAWCNPVLTPKGQYPAAVVVWARLREVEVHHVDLLAGYLPSDWPEAFAHRLLHEVAADLTGRADVPAMVLTFDGGAHELVVGDQAAAVTVTGPGGDLAAWLIGRGRGDGLTVSPDATLPVLPRWI